MSSSFGVLKEVPIRELWKNEASDFTSWLSHKENLDMLASELGIPLEFVEQEKLIGDFSVDLVAKIPDPDSEKEEYVVIENQLEDSDHDHLGKLITYAAGVNAKVIILICKDLRDEHRTAIDWLNQISSAYVKFFVVKIEAWQIDESLPAPKFNIICMPNDWAKDVKQMVEKPKNLTTTKKLQYDFWNSFVNFLKDNKSNLRSRKTYPQHWFDISIGTSKGYLSLSVDTRQGSVRTGFYSPGDADKRIFNYLLEKKEIIEEELGATMEWNELSGRKASFISIKKGVDITDKTNWMAAFEFLKDYSERIQKVLPKYLKKLDE